MPPKSRKKKYALGEALDARYPSAVIKPCRELRVISTDVDTIDMASGVGGLPEGRFVIMHGPSSSGKSTLVLSLARSVQRMGGVVVYADMEVKLDETWARKNDVDVGDDDRWILRTPPHIEKMFDLFLTAAEVVRAADTEVPILFVIDSLQAAMAKISYKGETHDATGYSPEARAWSYAFKKFAAELKRHAALLVGISQRRADVGGMPGADKVGVGNATLHAASMVLNFRTNRERNAIAGSEYEEGVAVFTKNQVAPPFGVADFRIQRNVGIDTRWATIAAANELGLLNESGSWYSFDVGAEKPIRVQGKEALLALAVEKPEEFAAVKVAVRARIEGRGKCTSPP